jgi:Na+-translocating ferredoxin:NAD+ oxidoreductase subunit B
MVNIYEQLRERLDRMGIGFPVSGSEAELRILEELFTIEDAELFLAMKEEDQLASEVASCLKADTSSTVQRMESMAKRGLLFRRHEDGEVKYRPLPFMIGFVDFQIDRASEKLVKNIAEYFGKVKKTIGAGRPIPVTRALPVRTKVVSGDQILPYDDAVSIVKSKDRVSLAPCLCRQTGAIRGDVCKHPIETCMQFDSFADYYVENGIGRYITKDEALAVLERNEERGLVVETTNSTDVELMCACCSCHCSMLMLLRNATGVAREVVSNYYCERNDDACTSCGTCLQRCPAHARRMIEGKVMFDQKKCLGCGLCVSTCEAHANTLARKPDEKLYTPPKSIFDAYDEMREGSK